jgi:hypothetical protein
MRIGLLTIRLLALLAVGLAGRELVAQPSGAPLRPVQAMYTQPTGFGGGNSYVDAYGNPVVVPAQYCGDACEGECYTGDEYAGDCGYAPTCDGYGECSSCGCDGPRWRDGFPHTGCGCGYGGYGNGGTWQDCRAGTNPPFPEDVEDYSLLPPGRTEQCGPHYFDVRMEAIYMTRDEAFRTPVDFASENVAGPIMLSSTQLDFDYETGFRILGRYDCGPLSVVEFGYWGLENLDASAQFDNPNADSYSLFSDFVRDAGVLPLTVTQVGGALPWTERSVIDRISLESELHTAEFNYRRYWVGFNPMLSGTLLAGFRYTRLREDFEFFTMGAPELTFDAASGTYDENIKNDLAGFQAGGDIWIHIRQGLRIGAEGKVGLMNNHYTLDNSFTAEGENDNSGPPPGFTEHFEKDQPALTADASADLVWDISPSWSIRGGYEVFFLNSVLLAGENFNTGTVYGPDQDVFLPERVPYVNNQGDAFYHGAHLGAEFTW